MPPPLMDGQVEYPDGTPATVSQVISYLYPVLRIYIVIPLGLLRGEKDEVAIR